MIGTDRGGTRVTALGNRGQPGHEVAKSALTVGPDTIARGAIEGPRFFTSASTRHNRIASGSRARTDSAGAWLMCDPATSTSNRFEAPNRRSMAALAAKTLFPSYRSLRVSGTLAFGERRRDSRHSLPHRQFQLASWRCP